MGLDQRLVWVGEPSKGQVGRLRHKHLSKQNYTFGLNYISENEYYSERYKHIRKYMIPEEVYLTELDWKLLKSDCGMPEDAQICGFGPNSIVFGQAVNAEGAKEIPINGYDERYWRPVLSTQYFYLCEEIYCWRNNYKIQEIFDTAFPEKWYEYEKKYRMLNSGYYPISGVIEKMLEEDLEFALAYQEGVDDIYYESNW